jgi:hypothetical protein
MTEPKRWIDDGAPDAVRDLLIAARDERPRRAASRRALVALGLGGALSAGAGNAAGATGNALGSMAAGKGASASLGLAVKWGLVGAATAAVVGVAGVALRHGSLPERAPAATGHEDAVHVAAPPAAHGESPRSFSEPAPEPARGEPGASSLPAPVETRAAVTPRASGNHGSEGNAVPAGTAPRAGAQTPNPEVGSVASGDVVAREATSVLLEEVAAIDHARAAVARGDAAAAISALNAYAARFKPARFEPEALYLRMEALGAAGDHEEQRRVAERLLAAYPNAPQAARARALVR